MTMPQEMIEESEVPLKQVRFSVVEEFEYEADELTEEEIALLWYTMEDMVDLVKHELKLNEEESRKESHSWRGLEHMQSGVDDRAERVQQICDAVLDAYDDLCEDSDSKDSDKAEALRAECRALTREDRKRAYKYGLKDQSVAEAIHKDSSSRSKRKQTKKEASTSKENSSSSSGGSRSKESRRKRPKSKEESSKRPTRKTPSASPAPATPALRMNPVAV